MVRRRAATPRTIAVAAHSGGSNVTIAELSCDLTDAAPSVSVAPIAHVVMDGVSRLASIANSLRNESKNPASRLVEKKEKRE